MRRIPKQFALFVVIMTVLAGVPTPGAAQTWIPWPKADGGNGHYFAMTPSATNWDAAEKLAKSWGGHLATITSQEEQDFVNRTFLVGRFEHVPVWIGMVDHGPPGTVLWRLRQFLAAVGFPQTNRFKWVTGEPISYTNWKQGEPNNSSPGEYYITINWEYSDDPPRGQKGDWNDTPLNGTTGYGGSTSGPYFGLVERNTAPGTIDFWSYAWTAAWLALGGVVIYGIVLIRKRRRSFNGKA